MAEPLSDPTLLVSGEDLPQDVVDATLKEYGFPRAEWADRILQDLAGEPPVRQQFAEILPALLDALRRSADPEMGLLNFARFAETTVSKSTFLSSLQLDPDLLEVAIALFSTSQFFSDILIRDIRYFDWLRTAYSRGTEEDRARMIDELWGEVRAVTSFDLRLAALRRFKNREMLRIGFADIVRESPLETIAADLSNLADAELEVAVRISVERLKAELGTPREPDGTEASLAIIGMGKLGARELNYSSDIDLIFVYSADGSVEPAPGARRHDLTNHYFFDRLAEEIIRSLDQVTDAGFVFRVDTRLRPDGQIGPLTRSLPACLRYYTDAARKWEHQALLKARWIAGAEEVGRRFVEAMEPLIYRKYLSFEEIQEIKDLKKRSEKHTSEQGYGAIGVKAGIGGIRDVEFIVQFHQLLLGGQHPEIRQRSTLDGLKALGEARILTPPDVTALETAYRFLRKTEHRLMTLHQFKQHTLPEKSEEVDRLAIRVGFRAEDGVSAGGRFMEEYRHQTEVVRKIYDAVFGLLFESESSGEHPEVDLLLSPDLRADQAESTLREFGFEAPQRAYQLLCHLAEEDSPFLQSPRTRKYLANLAPRLLRALQETPSPDSTLTILDRAASSLGAKTMLYHWLSAEKDALHLLLEICCAGEFLVNIVESQPGMFDDLIDSLAIGERKDLATMAEELEVLLAGADEPLAILNAFRNAELLRIGTRDRLGRAGILDTFRDLSNLAEAILRSAVQICWGRAVEKSGEPKDSSGVPIPFAVLGVGKVGGQEMDYFSDLDLVFVYAGDGKTSKGVYAADFFARLAQRLSRMLSEPGTYGKLYETDARLRPLGRHGPLACALGFMENYYFGGDAGTWERQLLTKLRPVAGDLEFGRRVVQRLNEWVYRSGLSPNELDEILSMRGRLEDSVGPDDIKRGRGGVVDIEFILQVTRLQWGHERAVLREPNEMDVLDAAEALRLVSRDDAQKVRENYTFLRQIENRLRMATNRSVDELPGSIRELAELAYSVGFGRDGGDALREKCDRVREDCRALFERMIASVRDVV